MTTPTEALERMMAALKDAKDYVSCDLERNNIEIVNYASRICGQIDNALALIPVIEANMLPELPQGYVLSSLCNRTSPSFNERAGTWSASIAQHFPDEKKKLGIRKYGNATTPRAAVLAAREKVGR